MKTCQSFWSRLRGALGKTGFEPLYFPNCRAVHTFGMVIPIDIIWLDRDDRIIAIERNTPPNRIIKNSQAKNVVETPVSLWKELKLQDKIPSHQIKNPSQKEANVLIESVFVLPVLLLIVFGFLQLALALNTQVKMVHAVHQSAFVGGITNQNSAPAGVIQEFFDTSVLDISIESFDGSTKAIIPAASRRHGDIIKITIAYDYPLHIPFLSVSSVTLAESASSRVSCNNETAPYTCDE